MTTLQAYLFRQILGPLATILAGLTAIALLTQGLSQLDVIIDERQSGFAFLWLTVLAAPQLISLILPLALFFAVVMAIDRLHNDGEIVVAQAAGVSNWQIISPILKLGALVALAHIALTTLIQPTSYSAMRQALHDIRADVAASLVQEGTFTQPAGGLTIYARETMPGGTMRDVLIHDQRGDVARTYTARSGAVAMVDGAPALVMRIGQIQQPRENGAVDVLDFDHYVLGLGEFFQRNDVVLLKSSDRYLSGLFFPDLTYYYDQNNKDAFLAEGHSRIAGPLLNIAMALIAVAALLSGDLQRHGYGRRIFFAAIWALLARLVGLAIQAACADEPELNALQYAFPIVVSLIAGIILVRARPKQRTKSARSEETAGEPMLAGSAAR
jgi:lipopolysaccharide export system permease protein